MRTINNPYREEYCSVRSSDQTLEWTLQRGESMTATTNPESNLEFVQKAYTTFGNDELEAFFSLFIDEFEWIVSDGFPYGGQYRGQEEVMSEVFSQIQADWERFTLDVDQYIDGGETIVVLGEYNATHGTTGRDVTAPFSHVWDVDAGKIQRFQQFTDNVQFHAALPDEDRPDLD